MPDSRTIELYLSNNESSNTSIEIENPDDEDDVCCRISQDDEEVITFYASPQSARQIAIALLEAAK